MRVVPSLAAITFSVLAWGNDTRWVEVAGGTWKPASRQLVEVESALKSEVPAAAKDRGELSEWSQYRFQYQGRITLLGRKFIYINAFCSAEHGRLDKEWVEVADGGACYFRAKFDTGEHKLYDISVNGVA